MLLHLLIFEGFGKIWRLGLGCAVIAARAGNGRGEIINLVDLSTI
jgi:hypothetical protein